MRVAASHTARGRDDRRRARRHRPPAWSLPGSITDRRTRCGRPNCGCHADPPRLHGPYWQWTRKIAAKTVCRWLSADQHHDYSPWIDNDRRLRELLARLEALGLAVAKPTPAGTASQPARHAQPAAEPERSQTTWAPPA